MSAGTSSSDKVGEPTEVGHSLWSDAWARLRRNRAAVAGLGFFLAMSALCLIGPWLNPYDPRVQETTLGATAPLVRQVAIADQGLRQGLRHVTYRRIAEPTPGLPDRLVAQGRRLRALTEAERLAVLRAVDAGQSLLVGDSEFRPTARRNLLGTDTSGRDLLARLMQGGQVSLGVGLMATLVSVVIGVLYGAAAGYAGGKTDLILMRLVDILYALPFTVFVIVLMTLLETRSLVILFAAIGAVEWLTMARIVRVQVMQLKKLEFVEAARSLGLSHRRILLRHIVPNALGPVIVFSTLTVPAVMLLESALSFLGLGVQPPVASWGTLIKEGAESMTVLPWLLVLPALCFSGTLLALNFLGDGLRDALDVRSAKD